MEESHLTLNFVIAAIVLTIIIIMLVSFFGEENVLAATKKNLTPELTINLAGENVRLDRPVPLEPEGYFYKIHSEPALKIEGETEADAFAIISFKGRDVKAKVRGSDEYIFRAKPATGTVREIFDAEITSLVPPLQEWGGERPLDDGIPVFRKSSTGSPIIITAFTDKSYSLVPEFDSTPLYQCRANFWFECDDDFESTRYLRLCEPNDPRTVCEDRLEVCGGNAEAVITDSPDCSSRKISADIIYKDGKQWEIGEMVGISFWKQTDCTKKTSDFQELLILCPDDRLGGKFEMNAGLVPA